MSNYQEAYNIMLRILSVCPECGITLAKVHCYACGAIEGYAQDDLGWIAYTSTSAPCLD